jgi:hypothetical protein
VQTPLRSKKKYGAHSCFQRAAAEFFHFYPASMIGEEIELAFFSVI